MTINEIIEAVKEFNCSAEPIKTDRGEGLRIWENGATLSVVLYEDSLCLPNVVDLIKKEISKMRTFKKADDLLSLDNLRAGVANKTKLKKGVMYRKTKYEGIVEFIYAVVEGSEIGNGIVRITTDIAKKSFSDKTKKELFDIAEANVFGEVEVMKAGPMPIVTNRNSMYGAVQMLNPKLKEIADRMNFKSPVIIPSSVHEIIILEKDTFGNDELINDMIRVVNKDALRENEILSDRYYTLQ